MAAKNPFAKLTNEQQAAIASQPARQIPGYWSTSELSAMLGIGMTAVQMQVLRGKLTPCNKVAGVRTGHSLFTDAEVARYLARPREVGKRKTNRKTAE